MIWDIISTRLPNIEIYKQTIIISLIQIGLMSIALQITNFSKASTVSQKGLSQKQLITASQILFIFLLFHLYITPGNTPFLTRYDAYMFIEHLVYSDDLTRMDDRPTAMLAWYIPYYFSDIGLGKYFIWRGITQVISALLFYRIVSFYIKNSSQVKTLLSLLFVLYPSDTTSFDIMSLVLRFVMVLTLAQILVMHAIIGSKSWIQLCIYSISLITLCTISFFSYEIAASITFLYLISMLFIFKINGINRTLLMFSVTVPLSSIVFFKMFISPPSAQLISFDIYYLASQLSNLLISIFISGWAVTFISDSFSYMFYIGLIGLAVLAFSFSHFDNRRDIDIKHKKLLIISISFLIGSIIPLLPFQNYEMHVFTLNRLTYFSSPAAVLLIFLFLNFISHRLNLDTANFTLKALSILVILALGSKIFWKKYELDQGQQEALFISQYNKLIINLPTNAILLVPEDMFQLVDTSNTNQYLTIWANLLSEKGNILSIIEKDLPNGQKHPNFSYNRDFIVSSRLYKLYLKNALTTETLVKDINNTNQVIPISVSHDYNVFSIEKNQSGRLILKCVVTVCDVQANNHYSNFYKDITAVNGFE